VLYIDAKKKYPDLKTFMLTLHKDFKPDIVDFHKKFNIPMFNGTEPYEQMSEMFKFRMNFLQEEFLEYNKGLKDKDIIEVIDATVDILYVALGTEYIFNRLVIMDKITPIHLKTYKIVWSVICRLNIPLKESWDEVHSSNMRKQRATHSNESKRGTQFDVIKPKGWIPPQIDKITHKHYDGIIIDWDEGIVYPINIGIQ